MWIGLGDFKVLQKSQALESPSSTSPTLDTQHRPLHLFPFPLQTPPEAGVPTQGGLIVRLQAVHEGTFNSERGHHAVECILGSGMYLEVALLSCSHPHSCGGKLFQACFLHGSTLSSLSTTKPEITARCSLGHPRLWAGNNCIFSYSLSVLLPLAIVPFPCSWPIR